MVCMDADPVTLSEFEKSVARYLAGFGFLDPSGQVYLSRRYVEAAYVGGMRALRCATNITNDMHRKENFRASVVIDSEGGHADR